MRILHCCIAVHYTEGFNYQENYLPMINKLDGNEVWIIASPVGFNKDGKIIFEEPTKYINKYGINVERVPFVNMGSSILTNKLKVVSGLFERIENILPDVILFHGPATLELRTLVKYKKKHPDVKIYVDSHADYYTSGTNWLSKYILHGLIFSHELLKALPYIEKVLYISVGCGEFMRNVYRIPNSKLEFFSLGGILPTTKELLDDRKTIEEKYNINNSNIILLQAGKLDKNKKVIETLNEFYKIKSKIFTFIIAGSISDDIKNEFEELLKRDNRVKYVGWMSGKELQTLLNASDIYLQPGKVSAIAQDAICRNCAVMLNNLPEYCSFVDGNGWLINNISEISDILTSIENYSIDVKEFERCSHKIAVQYFDYHTLASRLYR